jgi:hypothetical protein
LLCSEDTGVPKVTKREYYTNRAAECLLASAQIPCDQCRDHIAGRQEAARTIGLQIQVLNASTIDEINAAFATLARERPDALYVAPNAFFFSRRLQIATLTARDGIPTAYGNRDEAVLGGLMSYGTDRVDWRLYRQNSQRRQARRLSGRAGHEIRVRHQPQDRQGSRPHHPRNLVGHRRRGDPVADRAYRLPVGCALGNCTFACAAMHIRCPERVKNSRQLPRPPRRDLFL